MNQRDIAQVVDAIKLYTEPVTAEFRAYRAEVAAYRAESRAQFDRLDAKLGRLEENMQLLDDEVGRIARRVFGEDDQP